MADMDAGGVGTAEMRSRSIHIHLDGASPPVGEAVAVEQGPTQRFVGWLDLLRVLAELFEDENPGALD